MRKYKLKGKMFKRFLVTTILFLLLVSKSEASTGIVFEDDFSSDLSNWEAVRDNGSRWEIIDGKLRATVSNTSTITELVVKQDLFKRKLTNYKYEFDFTPIKGVDKNFSFNFADIDHWYEFHSSGFHIELAKVWDDDSWTTGQNHIMRNGSTYHVEIEQREETISLKIDGEVVIEHVDQTFNDNFGRPALKAGTGVTPNTIVEFDNVVVTSLDPVAYDIPELSQNDPEWKDEEYDSASEWVEPGVLPTFDRWACKLVSDVMLLYHHGITLLPDGSDLTPLSYNSWLNDNEGYDNGNVLPGAVSQLTSVLAADNPDQIKLEQKTRTGSSEAELLAMIAAELEVGNPPVLQLRKGIGSHFVLATGLVDDPGTDVYINDPEELHTTLSGYQRAGYTLASIRTYTASHTDLSRIAVVTDPSTEVVIGDDSGTPISAVAQYTEAISNPASPSATSPEQQVLDLAQPQSGRYTVTLNSGEASEALLIVTDSDLGIHEKLNFPVPAGETITYAIEFFSNSSEGQTTITQVTDDGEEEPPVVTSNTLKPFVRQLNKLEKQGHIKEALYNQLSKIADRAAKEAADKQLTSVLQLLRVIDKHNLQLLDKDHILLDQVLHTIYNKLQSSQNLQCVL